MAATEEVNSLVLAALAAGGTSAVQVSPAAAPTAALSTRMSRWQKHCSERLCMQACCVHLHKLRCLFQVCCVRTRCRLLTRHAPWLWPAAAAGAQPACDGQQLGARGGPAG
jgi:hypothetical protein